MATYTARTYRQLCEGRGTDLLKLAEECAKIQTALEDIPNTSLSGGFLKAALIDGAAAGDHTVTGIAVGDELVAVLHFSTKAAIATLGNLTSEFTVAAGKITNAEGTDTTDDQLLVLYLDLT